MAFAIDKATVTLDFWFVLDGMLLQMCKNSSHWILTFWPSLFHSSVVKLQKGTEMSILLKDLNQLRMSGALVHDNPTTARDKEFGLIADNLFIPFETTGAAVMTTNWVNPVSWQLIPSISTFGFCQRPLQNFSDWHLLGNCPNSGWQGGLITHPNPCLEKRDKGTILCVHKERKAKSLHAPVC